MSTENVFQDGPYLTAALLCERVLDEKDGVKSLIRIVSQVTSRFSGPNIPQKMPAIQARLALFISMKTGKKAGKHNIRIAFTRPDKTSIPDMIHGINLEEPESRSNHLVIALDISLDQEGVNWFDVYFDDFLMTRIPLSVRYLTQTAGKTQTPSVVQ
jgi:hypothetical protein